MSYSLAIQPIVNQMKYSSKFLTEKLAYRTKIKNLYIKSLAIDKKKCLTVNANNKLAKTAKVITKSLEVGNYVTGGLEVGVGIVVSYFGLHHNFVFDAMQKYLHINPSILIHAPYFDASRHFVQGIGCHFAGKESTWRFVKRVHSSIKETTKMINLAKLPNVISCDKSPQIYALHPLRAEIKTRQKSFEVK